MEYTFRLYVNANGQRVLGKGGAQILEAVEEYGSITAAAEELEMSYKFVWNYLIRMRRRLHQPVVMTHRGGTQNRKKRGGGGTTLTPIARGLVKEFRETERLVRKMLTRRRITRASSMKPEGRIVCSARKPEVNWRHRVKQNHRRIYDRPAIYDIARQVLLEKRI